MGKRRRSKNTNQHLVYPAALSAATGASSLLTSVDFALPTSRPLKPISVELQYFSTTARTFTFKMYAGNGEEVYNSKALLSGPIPKTIRVRIPPSTDFGIYEATAAVVRMDHVTNPGIKFVYNIRFEHAYRPPNVFF